jgi:hypothetical protein
MKMPMRKLMALETGAIVTWGRGQNYRPMPRNPSIGHFPTMYKFALAFFSMILLWFPTKFRFAKGILLFRELNGPFRENETKLIEMVQFEETDEKDQTRRNHVSESR